jgi:hypothetical protein
MDKLTASLQAKFPQLRFSAGKQFSWSPEKGEVIYKTGAAGDAATWSLLHETGHALLGHQSYGSDVELLQLEVDAWERAKQLATSFSLQIDENHIQDCLDTYRDWLYKRSICPSCGTRSIQQDNLACYRCYNCHDTWRVSGNRFTRAYRRQTKVTTKTASFL